MIVRIQLSKPNDMKNSIKALTTGDISSTDAEKIYDAVAKFLFEKFLEVKGIEPHLEVENNQKQNN